MVADRTRVNKKHQVFNDSTIFIEGLDSAKKAVFVSDHLVFRSFLGTLIEK